MFSQLKTNRLSLTSIGLLAVSLSLIFGSRILVSHFGLQAVMDGAWTPETLGAFTISISIIGYALMIAGAGLFAKFLYSALKAKFQFDKQRVKAGYNY
jgi:TRAP-type C4-dicarboxylate transport system permease small subunit